MPSYPPPPVVTPVTFVNSGAWAASHAYSPNTYFTSPAGDVRLVTTAYTSGASYGASDTTNSIGTAPAIATLNGLYASLGATYKFAIASSGDTVSLGLPLQSNGIPIASTVTIADMEVDMDYPPVGGACVWRFSRWRYGDPSDTLIGTVTVLDGKRSGVNGGSGLSTGVSLQSGDRILVRNLTSGGVTFPGQGSTAYVSFSGLLPVMPNPTAATGLTATGGVGFISLAWTAGTNSTGSLIYRDGIPYALTGGVTYTDTVGSAGTTPIPAGESHTYAIASISPGGAGTLTGGQTAASVTSYTYYPNSAGALSTVSAADWSVTLGTNAGTAATVATGTGSGILTVTSGAIGTAAAQDQVSVTWIKDTQNYSAWSRQWKLGFGSTNAIAGYYFSSNAPVNLATALTSYIQLLVVPTGYRFGFKAPSINSGAFVSMTINASAPAANSFASKTSTTGTVAWPAGTLTTDGSPAHFIGLRLDILPYTTGGAQTINFYVGTPAQLDAGTLNSLTPENVLTLSNANRVAISPGRHLFINQGAQTTTGAQTLLEQAVTLQPLSTPGT